MAEIIPAILPKNYEDLKNRVALVRGVVPVVQIDICDGIFVNNLGWPFLCPPQGDEEEFKGGDLDYHFTKILNEEEGLPFWEDIEFELDLMVAGAVENFDIYTKLGAKRMVFHIEAVGDVENFKNFLEGIDMYVRDSIEFGVAINTTTSIEAIYPVIPFIDFVQVMGIEQIGYQGQEFDERALGHILALREKFSSIVISVDGAVDYDTASRLVAAGAERLVEGHAIFNSQNIIDTVEQFRLL